MKLTTDQFQAITRYHFGVGPKPWTGHPHISVADLGRVEFDRVTQWWAQWAAWNAWLESGKQGPRPKVWRIGFPVSRFAWTLRSEWRTAHWSPPPVPGPPKPPPPPATPPGLERYQKATICGQNPMDSLMWHGCKIVGFTADPNPAYSQWVTQANGNLVRAAGKEPVVWYVPDQVSHERAQECARILGGKTADVPAEIWCDVELLDRYRRAVANGVKVGIANLSDFWQDPDAQKRINSGEFIVINEFYWNQDSSRKPDNHGLPVASMCIAVYDGHSDSTSPNAWEPHVPAYSAAGYLWPTVCVYSVNMTPGDWAAMP